MSRRKKNLCPPGYVIEKVSKVISIDKNDKNVKERARRRVDALWWETLSILMKNEREYHGKARAQLLKDVIIRMYNLQRENRALKEQITEELKATPNPGDTYQLASYDKIIEWYLKISEKGQSRAACDPQFWHESLIEFFAYKTAAAETKEVSTKMEVDHANRKVIEKTTFNEFKEAELKYDEGFPKWRPGEAIPQAMVDVLFESRSKTICYGAQDFEIYNNCSNSSSIRDGKVRRRGRGRGRGRGRRSTKRKTQDMEEAYYQMPAAKRRKSSMGMSPGLPIAFKPKQEIGFSLPSPQLSFIPGMFSAGGHMPLPPAISMAGIHQQSVAASAIGIPMPHSAPSGGAFQLHPGFVAPPPPIRVRSQPSTPTWPPPTGSVASALASVPPTNGGPVAGQRSDGLNFMDLMTQAAGSHLPPQSHCSPERSAMKLTGSNVFGSPSGDAMTGDTVTTCTTESGSGTSCSEEERADGAVAGDGSLRIGVPKKVIQKQKELAATTVTTTATVTPASGVVPGFHQMYGYPQGSPQLKRWDATGFPMPNMQGSANADNMMPPAFGEDFSHSMFNPSAHPPGSEFDPNFGGAY